MNQRPSDAHIEAALQLGLTCAKDSRAYWDSLEQAGSSLAKEPAILSRSRVRELERVLGQFCAARCDEQETA